MIKLTPLYNVHGLAKVTGSFRLLGGPRIFALTPGWYGWTLSCRGLDAHTFPTWQDGVSFLENTIA